MKLIEWIKALPASILFAFHKKRKFIQDRIDDKDEIYHTKLPVTEEVAGFKINTELVQKVLRIKYEQKYLPK